MAILGIDEVGRGPWAGPLVVGACLLPAPIEGLTDSKKLAPKRRTELATQIRESAVFGLGWISAAELDQIGLAAALRQATRAAVQQIHAPFHEIIIDGTVNFLSDTPLARHVTVLPKADLLIPEVSAASIIAKVSRDQYMTDLATKYPNYHFDQHMGYGTALHRAALAAHGPCPEHRHSFKPVAQQPYTQTAGRHAEIKVADYLSAQDHTIINRNWRTRACEIDIVSVKNDTIYFAEVKYRQNSTRGSGLEAITPAKLAQMQKAAAIYLKFHPQFSTLKSALAVAAVTDPDFTIQDFIILN